MRGPRRWPPAPAASRLGPRARWGCWWHVLQFPRTQAARLPRRTHCWGPMWVQPQGVSQIHADSKKPRKLEWHPASYPCGGRAGLDLGPGSTLYPGEEPALAPWGGLGLGSSIQGHGDESPRLGPRGKLGSEPAWPPVWLGADLLPCGPLSHAPGGFVTWVSPVVWRGREMVCVAWGVPSTQIASVSAVVSQNPLSPAEPWEVRGWPMSLWRGSEACMCGRPSPTAVPGASPLPAWCAAGRSGPPLPPAARRSCS